MSQPLVPPSGKKFQIRDYQPGYTGDLTREVAEAEIVSLRIRLNDLQNRLFADRRYALLVILQAIDTGGKDGTINSVFQEVGPLGCSVVSFGVPTEPERAHDYLWRYHRETPERGKVVIFNRSHYESVLVERVKNLVPKDVWRTRYEQINTFEQYLSGQDTVIMKFFLHISKDEQRQRLQERVDDPKKQWKFRHGDLDDRKLWDDYQSAFEDMVDRCNSDVAPWHVVPANKNWYRNVVVARALVERLEKLDLRYPEPEEGIAGLRVV
ncbi:MAG: polyphosphate kinase [Anaerolinea sp.]|nr:polyphosphate kinase [Anaerolinea sp.]